MELNQHIDHTLLNPTATPEDIKILCSEAKYYKFYGVCVNGSNVGLAASMLKGTDVKIVAVIGFPLGASSTESKIAEAKDCIENGADEIDMVINIGLLKAGHVRAIEDEIAAVKESIKNTVLKVIIETCYLTDDEKRAACKAAVSAKADFVKTSTGFGPSGATKEDVALMKSVVGERLQIKASGGIKDQETAREYLELGVTRIGTSSGVEIINPKEDL